MKNQTVQDIISANPTSCGRDLLTLAHQALGRNLRLEEQHAIFDVRPECGMDCEDECPTTGQPCLFP